MTGRFTSVERAAAAAATRRDLALRAEGRRWRERGVVHTPPEVARFVVSRADRVLVDELGCAGGLGDQRAAILDPACGPGAFLAAALARAGARPSAPRAVIGLDVDPEAVAVAEQVVGASARAAGWPLELRCADTLRSLTPFGDRLGPDGVAVILGNPPWAGRTANRASTLVGDLLEAFRCDSEGRRLDERKIGVLSDDYVRFWRWAAEVARTAPGGAVVALVTNGSYLDGPVHRGMRGALTRWFDGIDVVDLGGSALVARDGVRDENVFGVRPTVAIGIAWRASAGERRGRLRHASLRGTRRDKLATLEAAAAAGFARSPHLSWTDMSCPPPRFPFRPAVGAVSRAYASWISLATAMPFHREGVQTNRDAVTIDADRERLVDRLTAFVRGERRADLAQAWAPSSHYDPDLARRGLAAVLERDPDGSAGELLRRIAYRPFDDRWLCPVPRLCHRARPALLAAIGDGDPVLLTVRKDRGQRTWTHFGVARHIPDNCWLSTRSSCRTRAFPLLTPRGEPNLAPEIAHGWSDRLGVEVDPAAFLAYAVGVLASPGYGAAFDEALRQDYPRIPAPPSARAFDDVRRAGEAVAEAFQAPPSGEVVQVGHVRVTCDRLAEAIRRADRAVAPLLPQRVD